jgi:hypothetical protein
MSLCWTIAEAFTAVVAILRSPSQSDAVPLVRTMHEALADLRNLVADNACMDQIRFDSAYQQLKTFYAVMSQDCEYCTPMDHRIWLGQQNELTFHAASYVAVTISFPPG